jgi:hypothetical protein
MTMTTWTAIALGALTLVDAVFHLLHWNRAATALDKVKDLTGAK